KGSRSFGAAPAAAAMGLSGASFLLQADAPRHVSIRTKRLAYPRRCVLLRFRSFHRRIGNCTIGRWIAASQEASALVDRKRRVVDVTMNYRRRFNGHPVRAYYPEDPSANDHAIGHNVSCHPAVPTDDHLGRP